MTTLNARANQAWQRRAQIGNKFWPFDDRDQHEFEEGWETGYKTRSVEVADRLEDMAGAVAAGELSELLRIFAQEVRGGAA